MRTHAETISDAGKRISDQYNLHKIADPINAIGRWFAVALHDGTSDGVLYESRHDAVNHQHHNEAFYAYVQVGPWSMSPKDADAWFTVQRRLSAAGMQVPDRDHRNGGMEVIRRVSREDQYNQLAAMFGRGKPSNISYRKG